MFAKLGILAGAGVVERKASDLIGAHQNQSAPLVDAAMDEALGGVLFIDEVGGLAMPPSHSMAHEAVEALLGG